MREFIINFFRLEGADSANCYFQPEQIIVSAIVTLLYVGLGIFFGLKNKDKEQKLEPIKIAAIIHLTMYFIWLIVSIITTKHDDTYWLELFRVALPLFMCDIQLFPFRLRRGEKERPKKRLWISASSWAS